MTNRYYLTVDRILQDVGVDVGLTPVTNAYAATGQHWVQLRRQLNIALEELAEVHEWEVLKREHTFTTDDSTNPNGEYDLPTDFFYMIDQTHWDRTNDLPLGGPLSSQDWQYLAGRDLQSSTIYASFRQQEGKMAMWPSPPADGIVVYFEYISTNWIRNAADSDYLTEIADEDDILLMPPSLLRAYLKAKYLESKGFQTITAADAVAHWLNSAGGKDQGAPVLSMGGRRNSYPYLESRRNLPDTGYGS